MKLKVTKLQATLAKGRFCYNSITKAYNAVIRSIALESKSAESKAPAPYS